MSQKSRPGGYIPRKLELFGPYLRSREKSTAELGYRRKFLSLIEYKVYDTQGVAKRCRLSWLTNSHKIIKRKNGK